MEDVSYGGYTRKRERLGFVEYEALLGAWTGEFGGRNAATSYRRFVSQGLEGRLRNPLELAWDEWVIGPNALLRRMVKLAVGSPLAGDGVFNTFDIIAALNGRIYLTGPYAALRAAGQERGDQASIRHEARTGELAVDVAA